MLNVIHLFLSSANLCLWSRGDKGLAHTQTAGLREQHSQHSGDAEEGWSLAQPYGVGCKPCTTVKLHLQDSPLV